MRYLLQDELAPLEIIEAGSRSQALKMLETTHFDLVLTSFFSSEGTWQPFLADLLHHAPAGRLIILSGMEEPAVIQESLAAGVAGYVLKATVPEITLQAIRLVLAGGIYIPPAALGSTSRSGAHEDAIVASAKGVPLTERQLTVLSLLVQGASNKEIARSLDLSAGTVKAHVASLLRSFGAENRTELVSAATQRGPHQAIA
jgi:DNA-binding NarL/FixJ family response regulator